MAGLAATFRDAGRPVVHIVRLYQADGANADLPRRSLLAGVPASSGPTPRAASSPKG